ncbi:MAG: replication factor C large subunit [Candidatus Marsarchaeota archaeon]|jgi:replication factor C large subunit|nr:replication factor C large subunit [Candidatus Marsarchaeota archaeon]
MDLFDLYKISDISEIKGNDEAVRQLSDFAIEVQAKRAQMPPLVYGPPGTGKTAAVHALAARHNWNLIELNASDYRDSATVKRILISSATSSSLFGTRNVILLDEIDELSARFDSGAQAAVSSLIEQSRNPIIFIANDRWSRSISFLRSRTMPVAFKKVSVQSIVGVLERLSDAHGMGVQRDVLYEIAARTDGDVRSAINDMYAVASAQQKTIEVIGMRDKKHDAFATLDHIFMANTLAASLRAASSVGLEPEMLVNYLEENVPRRYANSADLSRAMSSIADASKYLNRANRSHYYTYWRYANVLMSGGVSLAKDNYPSTSERYAFPRVIKSLSASKEERSTGVAIAGKLQRVINSNIREIRRTDMALLAHMARLSQQSGMDIEAVHDFFMQKYGLTPKEISWMEANYA